MSINIGVDSIQEHLQAVCIESVAQLYGETFESSKVPVSDTRKEYEGDYTVVVFPFVKVAKKKPEDCAAELGALIKEKSPFVSDFNVVKGFLNLSIDQSFWFSKLKEINEDSDYGQHASTGETMLVEFASPNTNKPLHLGHIRNILLGWSVSKILKAAGNDVKNVQIVNDRGIAICRSMLAWQKFGNGETPESTGMKGDHFVGKYYVKFAQEFKKEYSDWQLSDQAEKTYQEKKKGEISKEDFFKEYKNNYFNDFSALGAEAKEMLIKWEDSDPEVRALWTKMNAWVLAGFEVTYESLKVDFDKLYFESDTYLLGKEIIEKGIEDKIFQQEDKRVLVDLENIGFGNKTIIKSDGTSTYTSQDIGTANLRYKDYGAKGMIYVVGDEQNSHFKSLFEIMRRLGAPYADGLHHLSYGMVDLPTGRMKSREGTVVDADDLIKETIGEARNNAKEHGELEGATEEEKEALYKKVGLGALKYFILKVNPQRRMVFNPAASVDMQGDTGPYIQNAYVRIQSILRKAVAEGVSLTFNYENLLPAEKDLIVLMNAYPSIILKAAKNYDPSEVAAFSYDLAKSYHKFYHDCPILRAETEDAKSFRIDLSKAVAKLLLHSMDLLGIEMMERM